MKETIRPVWGFLPLWRTLLGSCIALIATAFAITPRRPAILGQNRRVGSKHHAPNVARGYGSSAPYKGKVPPGLRPRVDNSAFTEYERVYTSKRPLR